MTKKTFALMAQITRTFRKGRVQCVWFCENPLDLIETSQLCFLVKRFKVWVLGSLIERFCHESEIPLRNLKKCPVS